VITADLILIGCWVYCILAIAAAVRHKKTIRRPALAGPVGVSILKPLSGLDEGLEDNLRSYFEQEYIPFEILFAVRHEFDPCVPLVRRLIEEYASVSARLLITGEPPYPHAKVFSLKCMLDQAQYDLIAMCDSDVRVGRDFLASIAADFQNPQLGLVTCPYRAISGSSIWSRLEAIGMNTDFHAGLFTAVMMEGKKFAVGPTIVARRSVLNGIGGIERVKDYISEDYMLGRIASDHGFGVAFSSYIIEHRIGSDVMLDNFAHRIRWARTTRRSRHWGYIGQFFTHPLPVSLLICALCPNCWPLLVVSLIFRVVAAWMVSVRVLGVKVPWHLLGIQDLLGFAFWIAGFFGRSINWRGQRYLLNSDGTVELAG
jgi:ceramide glucosyltransferase